MRGRIFGLPVSISHLASRVTKAIVCFSDADREEEQELLNKDGSGFVATLSLIMSGIVLKISVQ